jgi:beta-galactosidase
MSKNESYVPPHISFGVDYYPEHWPESRWSTDADLMVKMGLEAIRIAEFAWSKIEVKQDEFDFSWLDKAVEIFGQKGLKIVLGTPTASPPVWLIHEHPDVLPVTKEGQTLGFGGRHHCCHNNSYYIERSLIVTEAMAEHFAHNPYVIGWQVDNELGNSHENLCYCESCTRQFRVWLEKKYGTIEKLNEEWGTVFWSQEYPSFDYIEAPKKTPNSHNPSLLLDWRRFRSDSVVAFQNLQVEKIRSYCPDHFITHNGMYFFRDVDYYKLAEKLDFFSLDQYPAGFYNPSPIVRPPYELSANLDLIRGIKKKPFWVIEQEAGITGWEIMGPAPRPGQLALWAFQSIAHGADGIFFFRWRTCSFGTEQYWHGILPHSGIPGRRYKELQKLILKMKEFTSQMRGSMPDNEVAIVFDYDQLWALEIQPHHPDLDYIDQLVKYYRYFYERQIGVDIISSKDSLEKYKLVLAPLQYLMTPELENKFTSYVKSGGKLISGMRLGVKNENNRCMTELPLPGNLGDLFGIVIENYDCLREIEVDVSLSNAIIGKAQKWCDLIRCKEAETVAIYGSEFYKGMPAVTVRKLDEGFAAYIGFEPDYTSMNALMDELLLEIRRDQKNNITEIRDVEVCRREAVDGTYIFVMNHKDSPSSYRASEKWDLLVDGNLSAPYGYALYRE